jgi:sugar phosphate isomerase/epimerase
MENGLTRRGWLALAPAAAWAAGLSQAEARAQGQGAGPARPTDEPFGYCLNTSTVRGQKLTLAREAELAAKAGYHALEPWVSELDAHVKAGGSLDALGRQIRDLGLSVESAIGFFEWAVDDDARRRKALDQAKREMEMVRQVGGRRLAAPPVGATDRSDIDPKRLAERYRALLELGETVGVVPQAEVWGFSKTLGTLAEAAHVAIAADHPSACVLADVYHLYKGGSGFHGVKLLSPNALHVLHMNDYPSSPLREKITDADRVYPGDGVAPLAELFRDLRSVGFRGFLSIELFNRAYWQQDAATVLKTALDKLRAVVKRGLADPAGR